MIDLRPVLIEHIEILKILNLQNSQGGSKLRRLGLTTDLNKRSMSYFRFPPALAINMQASSAYNVIPMMTEYNKIWTETHELYL